MTHALTHLGRNRRSYLRWTLLGLGLAAVALIRSGLAVEILTPQPNDKAIARAVTLNLQEEHLSRHPLDAEMSQRCFKGFLKTLDPMKLYFMQSDYDEFVQSRDELAGDIQHGDLSFAFDTPNENDPTAQPRAGAFHRLLDRIDERMKLVDELLDEKHSFDFAKDEEYITDPKETVYASTPEEMREKWTKRIKYDMLMEELDKTEAKDVRAKLLRRYHSFAKRMHQITGDELLELYLTSLTESFDPHTSYMSASTLENFKIMMRNKLDGIGASLQDKDGETTVSELVPGGAAERGGLLHAKDRVIGVGQGDGGEVVDTVDMNLNDVVKLIRGKRGTIVRLKIVPVGKAEPKIISITRDKIELKNSEARGEIVEDGKKADGQPFKLGFIDLPAFYMDMDAAHDGQTDYESASRDVRRLLDGFNQKGVDAVVLDLRPNGGGALPEAIKLTGLFVDSGPVVQVKGFDGRVQQYNTPPEGEPSWQGVAWRKPLVVLQSKFSASASEIFAGAIQDYHRGLIVGDHSSHGKGTVQQMLDVGQFFKLPNAPSLGALKITIQQFYRPDGDSTQMRGVVSDVELPSLSTHLPVGESDLDYALKFDHVDPAEFTSVNMIDGDLVKQLQTQSAARIEKSADFKKVNADIARYEKQKGRKRVSLNREKFMAEHADIDADKEEEKQYDDLNQSKRPVVKRDYYINEVLSITEDMLRLSRAKGLAQTN